MNGIHMRLNSSSTLKSEFYVVAQSFGEIQGQFIYLFYVIFELSGWDTFGLLARQKKYRQ